MRVIRFEDASGQGPFTNGHRYRYDDSHRCRDYHTCGERPAPLDNGERGTELYQHFAKAVTYSGPHVFGFRSKAQAKRWFRSIAGRRAMAKLGTIPVVYEVPRDHVLVGNHQVAFVRSEAKLVAKLCPASLVEKPDA